MEMGIAISVLIRTRGEEDDGKEKSHQPLIAAGTMQVTDGGL